MRALMTISALALAACTAANPESAWVDLSKRDKPDAVTQSPWHEVVIGVSDFDDVPRFFTVIGGFETVQKTQSQWTLRAPGTDSSFIRFRKVADGAPKTRPFGSQSWDTGCYFSVMMRAKNLPSIIEDAKALGWEPLTELAFLEFGPSKLNIIVLGHRGTGIQVQLYERLTTPLPEGFTSFERISRPFNIMQMVADRDASYDFYQQTLGFDTFYYGKPTVSTKPEVVPIGIPVDKAMTTPYMAGIMTPKTGLEWGRMEMIEVDMEGGKDLSNRCERSNIGITEVRFWVDDIGGVKTALKSRGVAVQMENPAVRVKTPDGANIIFIEDKDVE